MAKVWAELNEKQTKICLHFGYEPELTEKAKSISGYKFISPKDVKQGEDAYYWTYPLEIRVARRLRELFPNMKLGPKMKAWGYRVVARERQLGSMSIADTAELVHLPVLAPDLYKFIMADPRFRYQTADIAFMATADNPLNANAPGLGKTVEIIASVFESQTHEGPQLILAPVTSMDVVWAAELLHEEHGQDLPVIVAQGDKYERSVALQQALDMTEAGEPFWLICNPQMAQVKLDKALSKKKGKDTYSPLYPQLFEIEWNNVIVDEFHQCGMGNPNTVTRRGLMALTAKRRIASSGTPVGGKTRKLWGVLNWLEPEKFHAKWRWFDHWLVMEEKEYYVAGEGKKTTEVGEIRPGLSNQFYVEHAPYMIRRTRNEVFKDLPNAPPINVWCTMGDEQKKQYRQFELKAELAIEEEHMGAIGILAQYTRLRQFAIAKQRLVRNMQTGESVPFPTTDSCKLVQLYRILADHGITKSKDADETSNEQVIVFSQFSKVVDMVAKDLNDNGITASVMTGATSPADRERMVNEFEARSGARVLCMNTKVGGVAITLNQSEAIVFMDETWTPDDQDQAQDRNRKNSAAIYFLRTKDTVEEYILRLNRDKRHVNKVVLDLHRNKMKELKQEGAVA